MEYVASGSNYMFAIAKELYDDSHGPNKARDFFKQAIKVADRPHHRMSVLFNAYQEQGHGEKLFEYYHDDFYKIHADSGGLQVVSTGKTITPELKKEIYDVQAKWSDVGMCFDEIPVIAVGNSITNMNARVFDSENFDRKAKETGQNVVEQINAFKSRESQCKPYLILQGNDLTTYKRWCELAMSEIPEEDHDYIGGVAIGFAGLGYGELESIKAAFYLTQLPYKFKSAHLLGIGSVKRLFPTIAFRSADKYDFPISYDSTSQTSGPNWGNYYVDDRLGSVSIQRSNTGKDRVENELVYNDIKKNLPFFPLTFDEYHEGISRYGMNEYGDDIEKKWMRIIAWQGHIISSIINFSNLFDSLVDDWSIAKQFMTDNEVMSYTALRSVSTEAEFNKWLKLFGKNFQSKPVKAKQAKERSLARDGAAPTDPKLEKTKKAKKKKAKEIAANSITLGDWI